MQFQAESKKNEIEKHFDLATILRRSNDLALYSDPVSGKSMLRYRNRLSREEATLKLRIILIEGIFIYFFAKVSLSFHELIRVNMNNKKGLNVTFLPVLPRPRLRAHAAFLREIRAHPQRTAHHYGERQRQRRRRPRLPLPRFRRHLRPQR